MMTDLIIKNPSKTELGLGLATIKPGDFLRVTVNCTGVLDKDLKDFVAVYESYAAYEESIKFLTPIYSKNSTTDSEPIRIDLMFLGECTRKLNYGMRKAQQQYYKFLICNSSKVIWVNSRVVNSYVEDSKVNIPHYLF